MNPIEELNYIPNYQQLQFQEAKTPLELANTTRKCLVQTYSASLKLLNNDAAVELLKCNLQKYSKNIDGIYDKLVDNSLKNFQSKLNAEEKNLAFKNDININELLPKPLLCGRNGDANCSKLNELKEDDLQEFAKIFSRQQKSEEPKIRKIAKSFAPRCCTPRENKPFKLTPVSEQQDPEPEETQTRINPFKSAREELNLQNSKKIGTRPPSQTNLNLSNPKKKIPSRRNFQNKFVSPMLSNTSNEMLSKSQEWPADDVVDERLKNIEPRMVELIRSEIMDSGAVVDWDDIAGLEFAKTAIQEAVVWPLLRPDIFTGLRRPPKGILLFGPPGTGKTLIGKCVASRSKSTFFSISASSLTSKWIGDGEKMVRALFAVARCHQPAVIFIDEIDSLLSQRSESEHESSRRIKTEFLVQLDGATTDSEERILVIGATNRPQELDEAARRRFVKRLYIPLPEYQGRLQLVTKLMTPERHTLTDLDIEEIARLSDGYSGADMKNLCSEASLGPIRCIDITVMESIQSEEVRPVNMEDFTKAICRIKSSVSPNDLEQYLIWNTTYGCGV